LLIVDGKMFSLIPESEESICRRVRLLEEQEAELNERMKRDKEEADNETNAKRQKL